MAQQVTTTLIDDIDGSEASETVEFGWGGEILELDLSPDNVKALDEALTVYVRAARRKGRMALNGKPSASAKRSTAGLAQQRAEIRSWAQRHGFDIGNRGRLPESVVAAFEEAKTKVSAQVEAPVETKASTVADPFVAKIDELFEDERQAGIRTRRLEGLAKARSARQAKAKARAEADTKAAVGDPDVEAGKAALVKAEAEGCLRWDNATIRAWGASQGLAVAPRGAIKAEVRNKYENWLIANGLD